MKLITELFENQEAQLLENASDGKDWYIEGIYAEYGIVNNNGRYYPSEILVPEVNKYVKSHVATNRAVGELNHPTHPHVNYERASHRVTELKDTGSEIVGKSLVLNTPTGQIIKGLLEGGVKVAISSRALGTVKKKDGKAVVQSDYMLKAFDIVSDPGAPSAFMNGIMEGVEYKFMEDQLIAEKVDNIKKEIHVSKTINEDMIRAFNQIVQIAKQI